MQNKIGHNNKCKTCTFFVVLQDGEALLGMPYCIVKHLKYKLQHNRCRERCKRCELQCKKR